MTAAPGLRNQGVIGDSRRARFREEQVMERGLVKGGGEKKRIKRNEDSLRDFWDSIKHTNVHIIQLPEREEKEKGAENIFEDIITENFPNLGKGTYIQIQEAYRVPNRINPKRTTSRHIVIKMAKIKDKERILKASRETQVTGKKGVA